MKRLTMMLLMLCATVANAQAVTQPEALQRKDAANLANAEAFMAVDEATQAYQFALSMKAATTETYNLGPDGMGGNWGNDDPLILARLNLANSILQSVSTPTDLWEILYDPTVANGWPIGKMHASDWQLMAAEGHYSNGDWADCVLDCQASTGSSTEAKTLAAQIKLISEGASGSYFEAALMMMQH